MKIDFENAKIYVRLEVQIYGKVQQDLLKLLKTKLNSTPLVKSYKKLNGFLKALKS